MLKQVKADLDYYEQATRYYRNYLPLAQSVTFQQVENLLYSLHAFSMRHIYALSLIIQWLTYVDETDNYDRRETLAKAFSVLLDHELDALHE